MFGAEPDRDALTQVLGSLGAPLVEVGHAVAAFARLQEDPASIPNREQSVRAVAAAAAGQRAAASTVAELSQHGALTPAHLLLVSSVLVDVERLIGEVDGEHGSHTGAVAASA